MLFILLVLFVAVKGLENSGALAGLSQGIERGQFVSLKLVITTFCLAMLVTNDVALIVVVPLTLYLNVDRKDVLVILEALAANAGSALTPFGNPQNLYIYWFYHIRPVEFITAIAPLPVTFLVLLLIAAFISGTKNDGGPPGKVEIEHSAYVYSLLLVLVILTVLRVLPVAIALVAVLYALIFDRRSLRVDFAILLSFFCFFCLANNLKIMLATDLEHFGSVFLLSAASSQIMSNVPVTLLFSKFTSQWQDLLWGANVGGFGSPIGSLANLIALRLYVKHRSTKSPLSFTIKFLIIGYAAFFIGLGLHSV